MRVESWRVLYSLGLFVAWLSFTARAEAQASTDVSAGIESYRELTLPNGLRVVMAVDRRVPQVALRIEYAVGDALDPPKQRGLAQLIALALPKLSTRHLRREERPRLLRAAGFKFEEPTALANADRTGVALQVPSEALELALWLEADRMGFAADGVSQLLLDEIAARAQQLVERAPADPEAATAFRAALGTAHPYGALDRRASLPEARSVSVAERLRRFYNPANAVLVLVGDIEVSSAEQAVRRLFGPLASAPVAQPPSVSRGAAPRLVSFSGQVPSQFSASVWETPAYLTPDDRGLDVVADVLARRLEARKLCDEGSVTQRSRRLTSVFVATCQGPKTSSDAWRAALGEELSALADGRVLSSEIQSAALRYAVRVGDRYDDLQGRAAIIATSVVSGKGAKLIPDMLRGYASTDSAEVAAIVRRHLLRRPDGMIEIAPGQGASSGPFAPALDMASMFVVRAEAQPTLPSTNTDWPRPPANGSSRRFQPPTGPTETFPNGDQLRFVEHAGVGVVHVKLQLTWPTSVTAVTGPILAELIEKSRVEGGTLEESLRVLGADLNVEGSPDELALSVRAPASHASAALDAVGAVLSRKELGVEDFDAAKKGAGSWARTGSDKWSWYWNLLGASAPKTRWAYVSPSARESALARVKPADVTSLWRALAQQPRAVALVGPFDGATARALAAKVLRANGAATAASRPPARVAFRPGVYVFDRAHADPGATDESSVERVEVCVLWPLPRWAELGHYPAHLMPWFFSPDFQDGFGARMKDHQAKEPHWQSNTVLTRDGDFLRLSLRAPLGDLSPLLESVKAHFQHLAEGKFSTHDFANAIAIERQFQVRLALSGQSTVNALGRAATHDKQANEGLDIALQLDRVTPKAFSELAKTLTLEGAVVGVVGPASAVTASLGKLGLKPTSVTKLEPQQSSKGGTTR